MTVFAVGGYFWAHSAAKARLAQKWPQVQGKDFPIPFPLTEAEVEVLRQNELSSQPEGTDPSSVTISPERLASIALERAVERGRKLATSRLACTECHGTEGQGGLIADAQPVWTWYAPNITKASPVGRYSASDWDRLVRHGVLPDDRNATMPSIDYQKLADRDVSDLAAWAASLPPKEGVTPSTEFGPVGTFLMAMGQLIISAEVIDHDQTTPIMPPAANIDLEFGQYVAQTCVGCHGQDYTGGPIDGGDPNWPPATNLTPHESGLKAWTKAHWMSFWKDGKRPNGTQVDASMPWKSLGSMSSTELEAMYLYFMSLEPVAATPGS
ncbi:MAG: cytochrome c [Myxococcota bacterium]